MTDADATVTATTRPDWLTVAALAVIVHVICTITHEAIGHGGACLLVGCRPQLVTTMLFDGDERALSGAAVRVIAAGGTIANLLAASVAIWFFRRHQDAAGPRWFFLWLLATVNLLVATGYLLYSGVANIGDWSDVFHGFSPVWVWRVGLTVIGGTTYWLTVKQAMRQLGRRLRASGGARVGEAYRYTLVAYLAAGCVELLAGLREPGGATIVLISGVAASFGGTSGLAWGPQLLRDPRVGAQEEPPLSIRRNWATILTGAVVGGLFVFLLGPGIAFAPRPS